MCDTLVAFDRENCRSFLGKNSDREPGELQFIYISSNPRQEFSTHPYMEKKEEYINHSFNTLTKIFDGFHNSYRAILSRPIWMWGAEMGVNEFGLSIGNEAVFSKEKVQRDGLLGMDILRLALHNNKTAEEAVRFIVKLISEVGQGGDGGYKGSLKYHNSFLIKDFNEAYVLETSGKHWALRKVDKAASISNSYTIKEIFSESDNSNVHSFKQEYQDKLFSFFSNGDHRQCITSQSLIKNPISLGAIKAVLRSHHQGGDEPVKGMKSVCMHSGRLIKSETTSSMIVDYIGNKFIVWFTGASHPCVTSYKPLTFSYSGEVFHNIEKSVEYGRKLNKAAKDAVEKDKQSLETIHSLRDQTEAKFEEIIYRDIENKSLEDLDRYVHECLNVQEQSFKFYRCG